MHAFHRLTTARAWPAVLLAALVMWLPLPTQGQEPPGDDAAPHVLPAPDRALEPDQELASPDAIPNGEPRSLEERGHILAELYERLSKSKSEEAAQLIAEAVERLWAYSGSATVDLLVSRAGAAISQSETATALQLLDSAIALKPDYAEAWNQRAYVYFQQQQYELAMADLARVLAIDPRHYKALIGVGAILQEFGRKAQALEAFRKALAVNPFAEQAKQAVEVLRREVEGQDI